MKQWLYVLDEKVPVLINTRTVSQIRPSRLDKELSIAETLDGQTYVIESRFSDVVAILDDEQ